jgi:hypothetical protein
MEKYHDSESTQNHSTKIATHYTISFDNNFIEAKLCSFQQTNIVIHSMNLTV